MAARRSPQSVTKALSEQGFPVKEACLVIGSVVVSLAVLFTAFMAYEPSRTTARVQNEATYLQMMASHWRTSFPSANYQGIDRAWAGDSQRHQPWTRSPNRWAWEVLPANLEGSFPRACTEGEKRCSHFWVRYDYRDNDGMSDKECAQLLMVLNVDFEVQSIQRNAMTASVAENLCDRNKPASSPYLYLVAR